MSRICKSYNAKLKAKVAIESLNGESSILEICKENNIPKSNLLEWRNKLISEAETLYIPMHERNRTVRHLQQEIDSMHKIIGEITIENSFLKKKLKI
jgi:transposase-like protein